MLSCRMVSEDCLGGFSAYMLGGVCCVWCNARTGHRMLMADRCH